MKVLIVSLLRVGDTLLAFPLIESLRKSNPEIEIHLLCNKESLILQPLMPFVRFHLFKRDELQRGLGEYDRPFFDSYYLLKDLIEELNNQDFDRLINVTQNRLSAWLCGALQAKEKAGLVLNRHGVASFGSPWFRYLNDYVAAGGKEIFHYSDIFCYGSGVHPVNRYTLAESVEGRSEADRILGAGDQVTILIQCLTSDFKKNWKVESWAKTLYLLHIKRPEARILLLGAPFEEKQLLSIQENCWHRGVPVELALCSFPGAYSLLCRADLLVTGDTSIKHLASASDCPVVELCIGSSDFRKTGTYRHNNVIIQSKESCAPCAHCEPCSQAAHRCGERVSAELVAMVADKVLSREMWSLRTVAREFHDEAEVLVSRFSPSGYWLAEPVEKISFFLQLKKWVERSTWKMLLEKEHLQPIGEFGSEGRRLYDGIVEDSSRTKKESLDSALAVLEKEARLTEKTVSHLLVQSRHLASQTEGQRAFDEIMELLRDECDRDDSGEVLLSYLSSLGSAHRDGLPDLTRLRQIKKLLEEIKYKSTIRIKLIRAMQSQSMERYGRDYEKI